MTEKSKQLLKYMQNNWERILFASAGIFLICHALILVLYGSTTDAVIVFGLGFLSFIYANVSRFKRFKGFGFEAELWEDKKKEAEDLIERLKSIVSIYTRELVLGNVRSGRWGDGANWRDHWKIYDDLVDQHSVLGQKINFSELKKSMDDYFLFDTSMPLIGVMQRKINEGESVARKKIQEEFGQPVKDAKGYGRRIKSLSEIEKKIDNAFEVSMKSNLAECALVLWRHAQRDFREKFDVDLKIDQDIIEQLSVLSNLYDSRPIKITDSLIKWSEETIEKYNRY
jgi:hypothetical protein